MLKKLFTKFVSQLENKNKDKNKNKNKNKSKTHHPLEAFDAYLLSLKSDDIADTFPELRDTPFLISSEYEEHIQQFNQNIAPFFDLPSIDYTCTDVHSDDAHTEIDQHTLIYKDKILRWQDTSNSLSDEFAIWMMSKLVVEDIQIRFDSLSASQSNHDWYALPEVMWQQLENRYGQDFVRTHFEIMPNSFYEPYEFKLLDSNC